MSYREMVRKLRETLEDALDCTLYPGTKRHDAAIDLLAEADALLAKEQDPVATIDMDLWPPIRFPEGKTRADYRHLDGQPLYATPPDLQARVEELERALCPRLWSKEMHAAWNKYFPDKHHAFAALLNAAQESGK